MSTTFTLDHIREASERRFGDFVIDLGGDTVTLRNPLRLNKDERKELTRLGEVAQDKSNVDDVDIVAQFRDLIAVVSSVKAAEKLSSVLGDDAALWATVFQEYSEATKAGEA